MTEAIRPLPPGLVLSAGGHDPDSAQMCVMEAVAYVAGEDWTDSPACACQVVAAFLRAWNDSFDDDAHRTALLKPFIPRLVASKSTAQVEQRRADLAFDWLARVQAPAWLDRTSYMRPHAVALRALKPLVSPSALKGASATLCAARDASAAAWAAASAATSAAARTAAWAAAWSATWSATSAVARAAARDAARAAARTAAWAAAWSAASVAARGAARAAARDAARAAARAAAWDALRPTVATLQMSSVLLVERMLAIGPDTTEAEYLALCEWPALSYEGVEHG